MLLLKNVSIITLHAPIEAPICDIFINHDGFIEKIGQNLVAPKGTQVFDKKGTCVSIGLMDVGTQTGDPGFEHREDLNSTAHAAMSGGFTTIAPFPNNDPVTHTKTEVLYLKNKTKSYLVDFQPIGALSTDCKGKDIAEFLDMHHAGAVAFGDGKNSTQDSGLILRGLQYAKIFDGLIINSPFNKNIAPHGQVHEGLISTSLGLPGIPALAEELMLQRDIQLLEYADSRLHVHNISTAKSVELVRQAKKNGLKLTASVAALNLCFDDTAIENFDTNFKVLPPLREKTDIEALIKGLKDGTIDFISTNHTPIDIEGKELEFPYADFGALGLETAFAMTHTFLHKKLTINQLVEKWAIRPREILGLDVPKIEEGAQANLMLFDPAHEWSAESKNQFSKSKNDPLLGKILRGYVLGVVNKGQFWLRD